MKDEMDGDGDAQKLPPNRAKRRKESGGKNGDSLRRRTRRSRGVAIPRYLQPWAVETSENDEG